MSTTKPETTAKPAETVKVKLGKPHTHEGKDYDKDAELTVDKATDEWLRKAGVVGTEQTSAAPAGQA
ncbi:hypothetical protein [Comamonas sp. wu1-DMT]|uniref:DUF7210 family protein n=1 Tax=Comamonas sp. wu1-DMT TaxID=3126390 RepID=UPI0032E3B236